MHSTPPRTTACAPYRRVFRISYHPSPDTVVFVGYGNSLTESDPLAFQRLRRTTDGFFVKLSYLFRGVGAAD
jgi:hypothetical protein